MKILIDENNGRVYLVDKNLDGSHYSNTTTDYLLAKILEKLEEGIKAYGIAQRLQTDKDGDT